MFAALAVSVAFLCGSCGNVASHGSTGDAGVDGTADAAPSAPSVAHVGPFVGRSTKATGTTDTFTVQAHAAGNTIVFVTGCSTTVTPTRVTATAPGWSFTQLGGIANTTATFAATAPDALGATVSVTWDVSCTGRNHIGDEFAPATPGGHAVIADGVATISGVGDCLGTVTTEHGSAAVWAACQSQFSITAAGEGFTKGSDDKDGDWSEYKLTGDPAGTVESVRLYNGNQGQFALFMVSLASP
jgi:hypothetical protein